jgi:hypothetical protein
MSPGTRILILPSYALAGASLASALFATANAQTYFDPGSFPPKLGPACIYPYLDRAVSRWYMRAE